jgi:hypothetical protein
VDELAGGAEEEAIELTPTDEVSLAEAEATPEAPKEDTVITAEGISIFDDEDLEIETADPMAKTQIAPSIEDQIQLEGVGSGSGLLDLTRESDDTSLGAEVLDHIVEEEAGAPMAPPGGAAVGMVPEPMPAAAPAAAPTYIEEIDPMAGLFGGLIVGCAVVAALLAVVALSGFGTTPPDYVKQLQANLKMVVLGSVVIIAIGAALGIFVGRSAAARQAAMRQMGG